MVGFIKRLFKREFRVYRVTINETVDSPPRVEIPVFVGDDLVVIGVDCNIKQFHTYSPRVVSRALRDKIVSSCDKSVDDYMQRKYAAQAAKE